jgi:hypothetical protein
LAKTRTSAAAAESAITSGARGQAARRVPLWLLGLGGAAVAGGYAAAIEKMRFGPPLVMVALGGLTLVLSAVALWRMIDPLSGGGAAPPAAARAPARMRELEREKQLVLKAIKEVELDYQMRKIAEADYREMIERYRSRAMRVISEIEAGDNYRELIERELKDRLAAALAVREGAPAPAPTTVPVPTPAPAAGAPAAANACASCGKTNDEDAQFCKKCGTKLARS